MAKRQRFTIDGQLFPTKKALQERVQAILWSYKEGAFLTFDDLQFMTDLLRNHPSAATKIGCGVVTMQVQRNPVYSNTRGFWLIRADGTSTDFSYRECLTPTPKRKQVIRACRVAIEQVTQEVKQKFFDEHGGEAVCPFTSERITYLTSHVDHAPPATFDAIFESFVQEYNVDTDLVALKDEDADNKLQDELADDDLLNQWVEYHNAHAKLRVISRLANLSHVKRTGSAA